MQKQNRNSQVHINGESGKTDFIIDPLLPIGKENAITTDELMRMSGCGSSRELRQRISSERERGAIICSGAGRGYWKPKNRQEIQEFIKTMDANALNSMSISLPHWLEKLTGFSSVGFNVGYWSAPMVPYLAQGAVIPPNKEFMAVLGDQKNGNNIEAPESLIRRIVREESGNNGTQRIEVPVYLNRREIARAVLEEGRCLRTVTGRNPFELI